MRQSWHVPSLTRRDIWVFALAANKAQVERVRTVVGDLDDDRLSATTGGVYRDDVPISHVGVQLRPLQRPDVLRLV
jgi:hypothetical protein